MKDFDIQRAEIERQMKEAGLEFQYTGCSDAHGLSIYYDVNGFKYRFSDHSVTNFNRVMDEVHFRLPIRKVLIREDGYITGKYREEILKLF